jgi:flagellar basal body-associated protein FliL
VELDLDPPPVFQKLPAVVTNLDSRGARVRRVRLEAALELSPADAGVVQANETAIIAAVQDHLGRLTPRDLTGQAGADNLKQAIRELSQQRAPQTRVRDVLFTSLIID